MTVFGKGSLCLFLNIRAVSMQELLHCISSSSPAVDRQQVQRDGDFAASQLTHNTVLYLKSEDTNCSFYLPQKKCSLKSHI